MIKFETIGMFDTAKNNPVITSASAVANYSFITYDGDLYFINNIVTGDKAYVDDTTFAVGEKLRGFLVKSLEGQKLVVDSKHIKFGDGQTYASNITAGTTLMGVDSTTGKLQIITEAPSSGVYFKVTEKCTLTEDAIKVKVMVADNTGAAPITTLSGLTDVDLTTAAENGQVLKYDSTSHTWKPANDSTGT